MDYSSVERPSFKRKRMEVEPGTTFGVELTREVAIREGLKAGIAGDDSLMVRPTLMQIQHQGGS